MMKNTIARITKKARVGIAALARIIMMTAATPHYASAQTINTANETATSGSCMDEKTVVNETNCSAHSEWKPESLF